MIFQPKNRDELKEAVAYGAIMNNMLLLNMEI
uniref:Uncharacterized protein n=1 Tax=viral metagenome TaxID=1070528 RepID=A0A6C0ACD8_9ZZZZ